MVLDLAMGYGDRQYSKLFQVQLNGVGDIGAIGALVSSKKFETKTKSKINWAANNSFQFFLINVL